MSRGHLAPSGIVVLVIHLFRLFSKSLVEINYLVLASLELKLFVILAKELGAISYPILFPLVCLLFLCNLCFLMYGDLCLPP